MSKTIYNYNFTAEADFIGTYTGPVVGSESTVGGNLCEPGEIVKLAAGTNAWSQDPQIITGFLNGELSVAALQSTDWDASLKVQWLEDYMKHVGLNSLISNTYYMTTILAEAESLNLFEKLSGPSIAYVTREGEWNEVSLGLNAYELNFIYDLAFDLPSGNTLRDAIFDNHKSIPVYVTNAAKVNYQSYEEIVYSFDGYVFTKYTVNTTVTPSLENGGGNIFGEVKLAGNGLQAHYIVRKDVNPDDPTLGLCSGVGEPLCMGDNIIIVDTTVWTENYGTNGTGGWTWLADASQMDYTWYLADVSGDVCSKYSNIPISAQLFPLRIIMFCTFNSFN
jgi:hypothetical protein